MAFDVGAAIAHIKLDLTEFKKGLDDARDQASGFGKTLGNMGAGIADFGKQAAIFTGVVGGALGLAAKVGLDTAAKFEQYQIAYTTLLGSQEKAAETIKRIQDDAAKTPFELAPLVMANQRLISAGVNAEDARADILNLGDAISATGGGNAELERLSTNLQQIKAVGKATALDIKQFAFAGINIYDMLAKSTGKNVEEVKEMDVSYEVLADAFDKAAGKGGMFHDAMKNQSASLNGLLSTLKDTVTLGLKDLLMDSGIFDVIRNIVAAAIPFITDLVPKMVAGFKDLGTVIGGFIGLINGEDFTPEIFEVLRKFMGDETAAKVTSFLSVLADQFYAIGQWIGEHQELVMTFLQGLAIGIGALLIIGTITGLLMALMNPLTLAIIAVAALYTAWQTNFLGIQDITWAVWSFLSDLFMNYVMPVIAMVTAFITENWNSIALITEGTFNLIAGIIQMAWAIIVTIIKVALAIITGDFGKAWEAIKQGVDMFFGGFTKVLMGGIDFIRGWGGMLIHELVRPFEDAWNRISEFLGKIRDALDFTKRHSPSVVDIVQRGVGLVNNALGELDLNADVGSRQIAGIGAVSGGSMNNIGVNIDMSGAMIGDAYQAEEIGQKVGNSIIQKLQQNVRF